MKHYSILSILAGVCLLTQVSTSLAQQTGETDIPRTISYQGMLTSTHGTPLADGENSITVTLYADPAGTIPIWQETQNATITNGIFNLYLGSTQPLPPSSEMNRPLWVGTALNGEQEMRPLTPLTASPYALNLPDRAVTTEKLADGAVTEEKVAMDYVKGFRVNGQEISGKGAVLDIRGSKDIALEYDKEMNVLSISRGTQGTTGDPEKGGASVLAGTATDEVWSKTGDIWDISAGASISPASGDWIGTSNNVEFTIKVNDVGAATGGNQRVMEYRPNATSANILGGHNANTIGNGVGNIIAGGGQSTNPNSIVDAINYGTINGGEGNSIEASHGTIGGGFDNIISNTNSLHSVIGGGSENNIGDPVTGATASTIAGGNSNTILNDYGFIGGGSGNHISGDAGVIAGGRSNTVEGHRSAVISGISNDITPLPGEDVQQSFIGTGIFNRIHAAYSFIGTGGFNKVDNGGDNSVIMSGGYNYTSRSNCFIGTGWTNTIRNPFSSVVGGIANRITGGTDETVVAGNIIGGGQENEIFGLYNIIGGGSKNLIGDTPEDIQNNYSVIGGGLENEAYSDYSAIAGGQNNITRATHAGILSGYGNLVDAEADYSAITGGNVNFITKEHGFIGGGSSNLIESSFSSITNGMANQVVSSEEIALNFIGTGSINKIYGSTSSIVGGAQNEVGSTMAEIQNSYSFIGGGYTNRIYADHASIVGGESNVIMEGTDHAFIGGGNGNSNAAIGGAISAGKDNTLTDAVAGGASDYSFIGAGRLNTVSAVEAVVGGGLNNEVTSIYGMVGGGHSNTVKNQGAVVIGGFSNTVEGVYSSIGGGSENSIEPNADRSVITGGSFNLIEQDAALSTIGGGSNNQILGSIISNPSLLHATIPGGDNLVAQSWAQTVIGGYNIPKGSVSSRYLAGGDRNDPMFIIGNGDHTQRSNAFEVSYNGHSVVYDRNGSGAARAAIRGATYMDNVVYAWGYITPNTSTNRLLVNCDFGVDAATATTSLGSSGYQDTGSYIVVLNLKNPDGTAMQFECGSSVTATIASGNPECTYISTSPIQWSTSLQKNFFHVYIRKSVVKQGQMPGQVPYLECVEEDRPFMFHVTGRPALQ